MTRIVAHLIRPQPRGSVGGADLHIVDLGVAQKRAGILEPYVIELGDTGYTEFARSRGLPALAVPGAFRPGQIVQLAAALSDADVIHSHGYESDYVGSLARTLLRSRPRLVTTTHGFVRTSPVLRAKTWVNEACLTRADALIACSRQEHQRLARRYGDRVRYVPNGVPAPGRSTSLRWSAGTDGHVTLGYVGRLSPEKRVDLAIDVVAALSPTLPDVRLLVFGAGPELQALRDLARRQQVDDRVRFEGMQRDVEAIYDGLDVLLCLSDSEGTPRVVLEAMARGVPVVATNVGGVPDLIGEGAGALVAPADAGAAADAVRKLTDDPPLALDMAEIALARWRHHFTAEHLERSVAAVYDALPSRASRYDRYSSVRYWEGVGTRLLRSADATTLAGDQTPFYRAKNAPVLHTISEVLSDPCTRWIEIGCGVGRNLHARSDGRPIVGVDVSSSMLRAAGAVAPSAHLVMADGCRLPFRDAAFDAALIVTVLQHTEDRRLRSMVREVCRIADQVHVFEDVAVVRVRDRTSHWLRPVRAYRSMFASHGFRLAQKIRFQMPLSELTAVAIRRWLNPADREEADDITRSHESVERRVLRLTRRLDAFVPPAFGLVAMTFVRETTAQP